MLANSRKVRLRFLGRRGGGGGTSTVGVTARGSTGVSTGEEVEDRNKGSIVPSAAREMSGNPEPSELSV